MTENVENLILEHLRAIRAAVDALKEDNTFIKARLASIEQQVAGLHTDVANMNARLDSLERRIDRIERRLEITTAH